MSAFAWAMDIAGSDDLDNLDYLGHRLRSLFLWSSGFHPQNKFSGCDRILCTCSLENSVGPSKSVVGVS